MSSWTVYRHYDANGVLLYVGCTSNLQKRTRYHKYSAPWKHQVARIEHETHQTQTAALAAEQTQIQQLRPLHNFANARSKQAGYKPPPRDDSRQKAAKAKAKAARDETRGHWRRYL